MEINELIVNYCQTISGYELLAMRSTSARLRQYTHKLEKINKYWKSSGQGYKKCE